MSVAPDTSRAWSGGACVSLEEVAKTRRVTHRYLLYLVLKVMATTLVSRRVAQAQQTYIYVPDLQTMCPRMLSIFGQTFAGRLQMWGKID